MTTRVEPLLTIADLDAMPENDGYRYEIIEGELFARLSVGSFGNATQRRPSQNRCDSRFFVRGSRNL